MDISKPKRKPDLIIADYEYFWWKEMVNYNSARERCYRIRYNYNTNTVQWLAIFNDLSLADQYMQWFSFNNYYQPTIHQSYLDYIDSKIEEELFHEEA